MKRTFIVFLFSCFLSTLLPAQNQPSPFGIKFSGFVRTDIFYNSRQGIEIREGHFFLYPDNILKDVEGKDINAKGEFNMLSINSRLKATITGPDVLGAKVTGIIEAEFFGTNENDINGFRLRHSYLKLRWPKTELIIGQYWHPFFVLEAYPTTVNFTVGSPFIANSRNPQIRLTYNTGNFQFIGTALTQRDFTSKGPDPAAPNDPAKSLTNSTFMRNAGIPNLNAEIQFRPDSGNHIIGAGIDYKVIKPELFTIGPINAKYATNTSLSSLSAFAFAKIKFKPLTFKAYYIRANNANDLTMIGGYAASDVSDTKTGQRSWTNIATSSFWADLQTNTTKWKFGLFMGYCKNLGSQDSIKTNFYYSRGTNIDHIYALAPRVVFSTGKLDCSFELEYSVAAYGDMGPKGNVINSKEIANYRPLFVITYNF